jgi:hypothetical protein
VGGTRHIPIDFRKSCAVRPVRRHDCDLTRLLNGDAVARLDKSADFFQIEETFDPWFLTLIPRAVAWNKSRSKSESWRNAGRSRAKTVTKNRSADSGSACLGVPPPADRCDDGQCRNRQR